MSNVENHSTGESSNPLEVIFFIQSSFNFDTKTGGYKLLLVFNEHKKYVYTDNLSGASNVSMILNAIIEGIKMLKKTCHIVVFSDTLFGITNIMKNGRLRASVSDTCANSELKKQLLSLLKETGHTIENIQDNVLLKDAIMTYETQNSITEE